ncbi:MAG: sugar phosphorylase [Actinomycetota bacterium]
MLVADRVQSHLRLMYLREDVAALTARVLDTLRVPADQPLLEPTGLWDERDSVLITYGDTITAEGEAPLATLHRFVAQRLDGCCSVVHVLPLFPYSSDDGFSIVDYRVVRDDLGDWDDVSELADAPGLMIDLVLNHCSAGSAWFGQFERGEEPGRSYFVTADPDDDVTQVVRPRTLPLLRPTATPEGERLVWCTFSHDQVDLDWSNPELLCDMLGVLRRYLDVGARFLRLDAVAYVWKRPGTRCIHLPETHELVKLIRTLVDAAAPGTVLVTETNVPNRENLKYFGHGDEAHVIYNFSLPPLVLDALWTGHSRHLATWMMSMPPARDGTAYLNFLASHDGVGLRPAEGLLEPDEVDRMVDTARAAGGMVSTFDTPSGPKAYELNLSLFDALARTHAGPDEHHLARFTCAHAIMLAVEGIPAVYVHSLLGTPNDVEAVEDRGHHRAINRSQLRLDEVDAALDGGGVRAAAFRSLRHLLTERAKHSAFHPNATQFTLHLGDELFGCWRQARDRSSSVFAVSNMTAHSVVLPLSELNLTVTDTWTDLLSGAPISHESDEVVLGPYASVWIASSEA